MHARTPARRWKDGFPCGNGRLGATLCGGIHWDRILVNEETWYYKSVGGDLPDVSACLPQVRQRLRDGDVEGANHLYENELRSRGYAPSIAIFQPGFDIVVHRHRSSPFSRYQRWVNMESAEAGARWEAPGGGQAVRGFVSRTSDILVIEFAGCDGATVDLDLSLELHDLHDAIDQHGHRFDPGLDGRCDVVDGMLRFTGTDRADGRTFHGIARLVVEGQGSTLTFDMGRGSATVCNAQRLLLLVNALPAGSDAAAVQQAADRLAAHEAHYADLLAPSKAAHAAIFLRARFSLETTDEAVSNDELLLDAFSNGLPPALAERMWAYGRYLLLCSSGTPGTLPSHLQGLWNGDYDPPWQCFYMANENIQMNYWQALPGAMPEALEPFFAYYEQRLDDFRTAARRLYGCGGIYVPATTAPDTGLPKVLHAHILYWISGAGWLCQHFYDYYLFTGDVGFLRTRAIPFLRETALFYADFLEPAPDGTLAFCPSISPENFPPERDRSWANGGPLFISENATMDVAICREVLTHLINGCTVADIHTDELPRWQSMLDRLPSYEINEDGAVREWQHPAYRDNYRHRHLSHLYPVFPGHEVTQANQPILFEAFRTAVEKRMVVGLDEQTGWSLAHMANIHARLGDGESAHQCLELLARSCVGVNGFTYHNDHRRSGITMNMLWGETAPFQIDANMGWTAAIMEMVLQSSPGRLSLLPALPEAWPRGLVSGLCARGGVTVGMKWNVPAGMIKGSFLSTTSQTVRVGIPGSFRGRLSCFTPGLKPSYQPDGSSVDLQLQAGQEAEFVIYFVKDEG